MAGSFTAIPLKKWFPPFRRWHFSESDFRAMSLVYKCYFLTFIQFIVVRKVRYARTTMQIYFLISNNMQNKFPAIKGQDIVCR